MVRITKYINIFAKGYAPNWSEEIFLIKKIKKYLGHMLLLILKAKKLLELFTEKNHKKNKPKRVQS